MMFADMDITGRDDPDEEPVEESNEALQSQTNSQRFISELFKATATLQIQDNEVEVRYNVMINAILGNLSDYKLLKKMHAKLIETTKPIVLPKERCGILFAITGTNVAYLQKAEPIRLFQNRTERPSDRELDTDCSMQSVEDIDNDQKSTQTIDISLPLYPEKEEISYFWSNNKASTKIEAEYRSVIDKLSNYISQEVHTQSVKSQIKCYLRTHRNTWRNKLLKVANETHGDVVAFCNSLVVTDIDDLLMNRFSTDQITALVENKFKAFLKTTVPFKDKKDWFDDFITDQKIRILTNELTYFQNNAACILQQRQLSDLDMTDL
eukprot:88339_1